MILLTDDGKQTSLSTLLRAYDCKYQESLAMLKKSKILIICQENSFGEISSKRKFQSLKNKIFPRKCEKTKLINYAKIQQN